jgi:hypothetical protein
MFSLDYAYCHETVGSLAIAPACIGVLEPSRLTKRRTSESQRKISDVQPGWPRRRQPIQGKRRKASTIVYVTT